ncbi:hypothetical protein [Microbacterium dextranolyticum]|uniref:Uncharacterized protein n=1 Tax=Microbacterium dextranolyticum TaxID=36806 RepID=A0A9W6HJI3_9MICO|nr:hypothetical protein [Microbacterium dextranolyticum]MBM7462166.1 hypothetical protein [Microbacterium dextranolyticum]GLJ94415.1 hypothetical protein GCM10017591_04760 [Microbacterium dextranolyticum]
MFEYNTANETGPLALDIDVEPGTLVTLIPHDFDFASATLPLQLLTVLPADKEPERVGTDGGQRCTPTQSPKRTNDLRVC